MIRSSSSAFGFTGCLTLALATAACGTPDPRPPNLPDCSADDGYERKYVVEWDRQEEGAPALPFFAAPTATPTVVGGVSYAVVDLPPEDACTDQIPEDPSAFVVRMSGILDWGGVVGNYAMNDAANGVAVDASGPFEGISFWARQIGDRGFVLSLTDRNTDATLPTRNCTPLESPPVDPDATDVPPSPSTINEGGYPLPGTCDNAFQVVVMPTPWWQFYTVPFSSFTQEFLPNQVETGIDPSQLYKIAYRGWKDTRFELWLNSIAFYRKLPTSN